MALNRLKAGCGLQPVPEEPGLNGTSAWTADTNGTDCASSAKLQAEGSGDADHRCGTNSADCRLKSASFAEGGCSDGFLDNVSEKDYRIWFPRAEVPDDDSASRGLSDWRTFREYRYTECAQDGRLEKTLSVEHVHKRKSTPMADGQQTTVSFQCAPSCSTAHDGNGGDQIDGEFGRVLSSTKEQLYREHHTQLLSRQDDSTPEVPAQKVNLEPKLTIVQAGIEREKEEKEECQTRAEEFALANSSIKTVLANSLANEPDVSSAVVDSLLNDQDGHSSQLESAGFHDVAAASEDDDMDEQKSTYVRADNVDSEVEVMTSELKETVVGGPSLDDLGYIAEEPEDEIDESASDSERWNTVSIVGKEQTKKVTNHACHVRTSTRLTE
ncbi:hypothetical protein HPB48_002692 [Haemaphysalis longicornis]|uniref:Uncharacterized protein n=1 Tax=Haemaphysalis longicornis TaxID=44386 RepID=A0A9J6GPJ3_HAELO|nr:hypothetical protein HPB48_002692 [Haemaphysalis longicornis]